ncbi:MAG: DUF2793 domain-containing protein [Paenirhodobacter sp.]|uniref:DUF2793 domain-containing protein n=1 Tax=Paenirhodobacter sp. TaxID=1965326 RepID=UPI003D0F0500
MADQTPLLGLPYILPSQAQKHVTHNEALNLLDTVVQLAVLDRTLTAPPSAPVDGDRYIVAAGGTSEWQGHDGEVAMWQASAWTFAVPRQGWQAWVIAEETSVRFDGSDWIVPPLALDNLAGVGINATADATNRLTVFADATLLSHDGGGHQLKINKSTVYDTASLLFQTSWFGRAEMGTAGNDRFAIKVSADGSSWTEALSFDGATGIPAGAAVQQSATDTTAGRLMRADYGYGPGNLLGTVAQSGGVPQGAVIERGTTANGEYIRLADGTQICFAVLSGGSITASGSGTWADPYRSADLGWTFPAAFSVAPVVQASAIPPASLAAARRRAAACTGAISATAAAQIHVVRLGDDGTADDFGIGVTAIGRWF